MTDEKYRIGILTSLDDDDAVKLMQTVNGSIEDGTILGEVSLVICNRSENNPKIRDRVPVVRELEYVGSNIEFLPSSGIDSFEYDRRLMELFTQAGVRIIQNIGWKKIIGSEMTNDFEVPVINLHPAPPYGPVGWWKIDVMPAQAERPLPYLLSTERFDASELEAIMDISYNRAGGMLHIATQEVDRGPVIAWYEFALASSRLYELWCNVATDVKTYGTEEARKKEPWQELCDEIRREQVKGEHPLLVLTYQKITSGVWDVRKDGLYIREGDIYVPVPDGYCINRDLGANLKARGIETLIK